MVDECAKPPNVNHVAAYGNCMFVCDQRFNQVGRMIGKLIYKLLKPVFLKHYFNDQSKKTGFENLNKAFIDSNGKTYYACENDLMLPIARSKELQRKIQLIRAGMSEDNLSLMLQAMKKALNGGKKADLAEIGFLIIETERRIGIWVDPDLLYDTVALMYIREDERPEIIDVSIHKEKVEQFKKDSTGGLRDFFYMTGLQEYIPCLGTSASEWNEYFQISEVKMKALKMHMEAYITG